MHRDGYKGATPPSRAPGIGGFFFRSGDPKALAAWYPERLGVKTVPDSYEDEAWRQEEGETVFAPLTVEVDPERYPNGRFAELRDPEGNGIQLWQPMGPP
jgi:glyoxylase I family protein